MRARTIFQVVGGVVEHGEVRVFGDALVERCGKILAVVDELSDKVEQRRHCNGITTPGSTRVKENFPNYILDATDARHCMVYFNQIGVEDGRA
jgi:hypothetical protein